MPEHRPETEQAGNAARDGKGKGQRAPGASGLSRRRLIQMGLAVPPVIITLSGRPAFGQSCTPSVEASVIAGTSLTHDNQACLGLDSTYWAQHYVPQSQDPTRAGPVFADMFGANWDQSWKTGTRYGDILHMNGNRDPVLFGACIIAAHLNTTNLPSDYYPMTETQVLDMGRAIIFDGQYYPAPTADPWTVEDVVAFLLGTFNG